MPPLANAVATQNAQILPIVSCTLHFLAKPAIWRVFYRHLQARPVTAAPVSVVSSAVVRIGFVLGTRNKWGDVDELVFWRGITGRRRGAGPCRVSRRVLPVRADCGQRRSAAHADAAHGNAAVHFVDRGPGVWSDLPQHWVYLAAT